MGRARELAEVATTYETGGGFGFKNRIINSDMRIDQRNAGAAVTPNQSDGSVRYLVDRFGYSATQASRVTWQQSTTVPTGFRNSLIGTVVSAVASPAAGDQFTLCQFIEGFNVADFGWGTANAQTVTLSFWVRSSVTGTYAVALGNNAFNRQYVATYSVSSANTWEFKTITVAGDTTGTWTTDNTAGIRLNWDLGSGSNNNGTANAWQAGFPTRTSSCVNWISTNGATFFITGVQLEAGTVASPFERRDYGRELIMCQRYAYILNGAFNGSRPYNHYAVGVAVSSTQAVVVIQHPVFMRGNATPTAINATSNSLNGILLTSAVLDVGTPTSVSIVATVSSGLTAGNAVRMYDNGSGSSALLMTAEL